MITLTPHGLHLPAADLYLDARDAPGTVFVSHAHSDHCTRAARMLCTPETAALHQARRGDREALVAAYGVTIAIGDAEATLTPASHTLGSAMLAVRSAEGTIAYTGDYKLRPNPFSPPSVIPRCDTLVMESTFGEPRYRFPPDDELVAQLYDFADAALAEGATPVVLAYALGKGQEALWHLTRRGYHVAVHGAIDNLCHEYVRLGHAFPGPGTWTRYRRGETEGRVLLTTPSSRKSPMVQKLARRRVCHLTGWASHPGAHNIYKDCDLVLPLSDHADFDALVRTAQESGARKVFTTHGPASFAAHLRTLGIDAEYILAHPNEVPAQGSLF